MVGENLYLKTHKGEVKPELMDWEGAVKTWYEEIKDFDIKNIFPLQQTEKLKDSLS